MDDMEWKEREKIYACWLCNFPNMGNGQLHRLLELCGGPEAVYLADREKWGQALTPNQVRSLAEYTAEWRPEAEYHRMKEEGIELVTVGDDGYPERLRNIPDAPYGLFIRGRLSGEDAPAVAIIGARECSEYGRYVARQLGAALGRRGVTVISGMARGIDGISQEAALEAGGYSIGVLGSGVDVCYPAQNRELYGQLIKRGAVLSTYPIGSSARPQNFPPRNRIVSGLADAVVVIEARVKSGTLITVDMALEQGREVYVVPGRVTDRLSDGCNRLIKQGAGVLLSPESFLEEIWQLWQEGKKRAPGGGSRESAADPQASDGAVRHGRKGGGSRKPGSPGTPCPMEGQSGERAAVTMGKRPRAAAAVMPGVPEEESPDGFKRPSGTESLPDELSEVYGALDFYPKSVEEIRQSLSERYPDKYQDKCSDIYPEKRIIACLMQLCMESLAIQMSPGHFCCKRR